MLEIRAAIKAVKATKTAPAVPGAESGTNAAKKAAATKSRKGA